MTHMNMKKRYQFQLGLAAIEFALILPVLLILAFATIDFGRLLFQYDILTKSTRDATKYIARTVKPAANALQVDLDAYTAIENQARNLALCGTIASCNNNPLVSGLSASNVFLTYPAPDPITGIRYVQIQVNNYSTTFLTSALGSLVTKNLGPISVTMRQIQQ